jgi:hypothetical protein
MQSVPGGVFPMKVAHGWGLTARTVRQSRPRNVLQPSRWTPAC